MESFTKGIVIKKINHHLKSDFMNKRNYSIFIFGFILLSARLPVNHSEIKKESTIDHVYLFLEGAQIFRSSNVALQKGVSLIRIGNLSPYIEANSIQLKLSNKANVVSVKYERNYLQKNKNEFKIDSLNKLAEALNDSFDIIMAKKSVITEDMAFIKTNLHLSEKSGAEDLKSMAEYYSKRLEGLKMKEIDLNRGVKIIDKRKADIKNQLSQLGTNKELPFGEIVFEIEAKEDALHTLDFSYYTKQASWIPQYDVRCETTTQPLDITYRAIIKQDSGEDWKKVKMTLSTENPTVNKNSESLRPYFINYNFYPPQYGIHSNIAIGFIKDSQGQPLIGANVLIEGSTIGTTTDIDGKFELVLLQPNQRVKVLYVGFKDKTLNLQNGVNDIYLEEDNGLLDEVVIRGSRSIEQLSGITAGLSKSKAEKPEQHYLDFSKATFKQHVSGFEYDLDDAISLKSGEKNRMIDISKYTIMPIYQFVSTPKIGSEVYLNAYIKEWKQEGLMDGQANVYYEESYIGKTILSLNADNDSIHVSLGIDRALKVTRQKVNESSKKPFLSGKKQDLRSWTLTATNNKSIPVSIDIYDQIPVSTNEDIEVEFKNESKAELNKENGILLWKKNVIAKGKEKISFSYLVKHSSSKSLYVD